MRNLSDIGSPAAWIAVALLGIAATGCARYVPYAGRDVAATAPKRANDGVAASADEDHDHDDAPRAAASGAAPSASIEGATFREAMPKTLGDDAPAVRYGKLGGRACRDEVKRRQLAFAPVKTATKNVSGAMRVTGKINGIQVSTPPSNTKWGILDCRMALLLDDLTKELADRDVVAISIDNIYRPGAHLPGKKKASQHAFGLALDITRLKMADGSVIAPETWGASIGETPCGPEATMASPTPGAVATRNMICEIGRKGFFHTILTPSFDAAHATHFHLDIKKDGKSCGVR